MEINAVQGSMPSTMTEQTQRVQQQQPQQVAEKPREEPPAKQPPPPPPKGPGLVNTFA
jgi:hypothetical protein